MKYFFAGEQEWRIHISTKNYGKYQNPLYDKYAEFWGSLICIPEVGIDLYVYSLKDDLYGKLPLRGDLHVHTSDSDGAESPEIVAAYYRKAGRDFIAITDHNVYHSADEFKDSLGFIKGFNIISGEEVHNGYAGYHTVNIGGNYSVNDIYVNESERVKKEVKQLEKEITVPENLNKNEYLNRVWLYREIKKSGGYAIHAHPYWGIGYWHTSTEMSKAMLKNGLCDAFEVLGGGGTRSCSDNLHVALYNDLRAEGCDIPIVGSTDSHSVFGKEYLCHSTLVFSDDGNVINAIDNRYSVAIETKDGERARVYGKLRLVFYTHFLLENYYPLYDELCAISGKYIDDYVKGSLDAKQYIEKAEDDIERFKNEFFDH